MTAFYLISPPSIDIPSFTEDFKRVCGEYPPAVFQLRLKDASDGMWLSASEGLLPICEEHQVVYLINDKPDIAKQTGAAGVHIGEEDVSYQEARELLGENAVIGVSCYDSRHNAMEVAEKGASYVAFGSVFPTTTKEPKTRASLDILQWWADYTTVPGVAIGGINHSNLNQVKETGIDFAAMISAVWSDERGVDTSVAEIRSILEQ